MRAAPGPVRGRAQGVAMYLAAARAPATTTPGVRGASSARRLRPGRQYARRAVETEKQRGDVLFPLQRPDGSVIVRRGNHIVYAYRVLLTFSLCAFLALTAVI